MEYILPLLSVFISLVALYFSYTATYSEEILLRKLKKLKFDFILVPNQQCSSLPSTQFIEKFHSLSVGKCFDIPKVIQVNFKVFYACNSKKDKRDNIDLLNRITEDNILDICQNVIMTRQGRRTFGQNPFFVDIK